MTPAVDAEEGRADERADAPIAGAAVQSPPKWLEPSRDRRTRVVRLLVVLGTLALLIVLMADLVRTRADQRPIARVASLGSSFAAGPSIPPEVDAYAGRSGNNYAALLSRRLRLRLTDLSVSGATLLNLLSVPQYAGNRRFAPQIDDLPGNSDLVLVLGGGNDIDYVGGLMRDVARLPAPYDLDEYDVLDSADALAQRFGRVLDAVHAKEPAATVLVVEYLALLGDHFEPGRHAPFGPDRAAYHRNKEAMLQNGTRAARAAREDWCHIVPVSDLSREHAIGSPEPWVTDFEGLSVAAGVPYHPNAAGMKAVERMVLHKMVELGLATDDEL